ncbi:MAG: HAMP domain-containing protein [Lachnospiraceae bacterium]|nr:HAMP domain-containing protein [Lachnospiraceae bacterium]
MKGQKKEVRAWASIRVKIIILIIMTAFICNGFNLWSSIPTSRSLYVSLVRDIMVSSVEYYGEMVDDYMSGQKTNGEEIKPEGEGMQSEQMQGQYQMLDNLVIRGMDTSICYLVDADNIIVYHPDSTKIGTILNSNVTEALSKASLAEDIAEYAIDGEYKYGASYRFSKDGQTLIVEISQSEVRIRLREATNKNISTGIFALFINGILAAFYIRGLVNPIKKLTSLIFKIAALDFTKDETQEKLSRRMDEIGAMSRAIGQMREHIGAEMEQIQALSVQLDHSSKELNQIAFQVNEDADDNSASAEELAAGMEETTATAENIHVSIVNIQSNANDINALTQQGTKMADEILVRADILMKKTDEADRTAKRVLEQIKKQGMEAIERAGSVEKIQEMTSAIEGIARQTSLLSLNASIEAARAGESGRGFAVVASEIGNLADQSTQMVGSITDIVKEVKQAVQDMRGSMEQILSFMQTTVSQNFEQFQEVTSTYSNDADSFKTSMMEIYTSMSELEISISGISEAVSGISSTLQESARAVGTIAERTSNTASLTGETTRLAEESVGRSKQLADIVDIFKL